MVLVLHLCCLTCREPSSLAGSLCTLLRRIVCVSCVPSHVVHSFRRIIPCVPSLHAHAFHRVCLMRSVAFGACVPPHVPRMSLRILLEFYRIALMLPSHSVLGVLPCALPCACWCCLPALFALRTLRLFALHCICAFVLASLGLSYSGSLLLACSVLIYSGSLLPRLG